MTLAGAIDCSGATSCCCQPRRPLAHIIERYLPAPSGVDRPEALEVRIRVARKAQPHEHTLKQTRFKSVSR
jgi:hypothetical protein